MKNQEKKNKVIIALAQAYENGNTALTNRVESIVVPDEQELPKELQKCLESWGKTPIEEPEFFKLTTTAKLEDLKLAAVKDLDIDAFDAIDIGTLANRVYRRITDKIDEDGKYKTTENIDKVKLPRTTALRELKKLAHDKVSDEKITKEIFKRAGAKEKDLSKWEVDLIKEMIFSYVQAVDNDTMGSYTDRTPFARYIKNV